MTKDKHYQKTSPQTQEGAFKIAKATQRPGQTKEQTKLIAQGIEKGISHYKKQQKEKSRALNKKLSKVSRRELEAEENSVQEVIVVKQSTVAWGLLGVSWIGFFVYLFGFKFAG